jgi:hypothetical protein
MDAITRSERFFAAAAGEYDGELPAPITRQEQYLKKIIEEIDGGSVSPEQIDAAIEAYLNSHDADIVTEQELSDELSGYYNKTDIDNALDGKADSTDIPDVSDFVTTAALAEKQDALTAGDNISIETINGELTISAIDTTYSDATQQAHGLMSTADKTKLDSITAAKIQAWDAAEQNVNADWNAESGDAQILHKPDLSVYALAANVTKSALGIDNVDNTSDADKPISTATETALAGKVDKETNKSLMTADEHTKLNGIEAGAQVNVQLDWEQNNSNADDFIKNKPANLVQDASYVHTDNNFTNAEKAKADGAIQSTEKGTAGGVAELDEYGHVPVSQLPSFVSDVIDGYYDSETTHKFYADAQHQTEIQGQSNKIYVDVNTNLSYRWSGSVFAEVSPSLALGSTDSTAYRGDWGTADHAAIGVLASLNTSEKSNLVAAINELQSGSVSVDPDRGLSENDFTDSLKSKLDGIESGAEVNVQSDWNQTVTTADDFIKNKPEDLVQDASYVHTDNNYTTDEKTKLAGISAGAQVNTVTGVKGNAENDYRTGDINISPANIGLGNVNNTSDANKPISTATQAALNAKQDALTAGTGISLLGTTISHADTSSQTSVNNSGRTYIQNITLDDYGHVTGVASATETVTNTDTKVTSAANHYAPTTVSGSDVSASATGATAAWSIDVVKGVTLNTDGKGHVTGMSVTSGKIPANPNTDTKVTSVGNHYAPAEDTSAVLSADASSSTSATWNSTSLVTGVDIKRDVKGHVVGVAVDSIKMPANPNTNTTYSAGTGLSLSGTTFNHSNSVTAGTAQGDASKTLTFGGTFTVPTITYDAQGHITAKGTTTMTMPANPDTNNAVAQTATTASADYEVLFSATADNTTRTEGARKNSNLKFNPSTGNLQVTQINGVTVGSSPKFTDTNTTYSSKTAASGGTDVSLCTTGEKYAWNNKSNLAIGTTSTTAAAGNHTHTTSIANSSGTNALTLAASTKYALTAGGNSFIFTTAPNTTYSAGTGLALSGTTFSTRADLYTNASGTDVANNGTITLTTSAANYNFVEIYYKQADGEACAKGRITTPASGTSDAIQLLSWTFNSGSASLSFIAGTATLTNATTLEIVTSSSSSFKIYKVVGYK